MSFRNVHNTRDVLFRLCANTNPQRDSIFTKGPDDVLDHVTSEIAIGSELGTGATKTRRRRLQTPLAVADQDGRNCGQTVLLAGSQPQAKSDVPAVIARCDPNFAPKDVREVARARIAHVEPDFDHTLRRLSQ